MEAPGAAVNTVRKQEQRDLSARGDRTLIRTKYFWLQAPENMSPTRRRQFDELRTRNLKVARAWAIKESARELWSYVSRGWAKRGWERWLSWAMRSRIEPIKKAARTVRYHLWGILNAVVLDVTNAPTESLNAKIQWVKKNACGSPATETASEPRFSSTSSVNRGSNATTPAAAATLLTKRKQHPRERNQKAGCPFESEV